MGRSGDPRAQAVAEALAPYRWREFTERMLARRVVAATDRHAVVAFVASLPGADVGGLGPLQPVGPCR